MFAELCKKLLYECMCDCLYCVLMFYDLSNYSIESYQTTSALQHRTAVG